MNLAREWAHVSACSPAAPEEIFHLALLELARGKSETLSLGLSLRASRPESTAAAGIGSKVVRRPAGGSCRAPLKRDRAGPRSEAGPLSSQG